MRKILFIIYFIPAFAISQNRNSIWCFGDSAGIDFSSIINPVSIQTGVRSRGSCASISDSLGHLLFYSFNKASTNDSGTFVFNNLNDTMQNGINLNGQFEYSQIVIVPNPSSINLYYVIHSGVYSTQGLYYSVVDMSLNNGLGAVIQKNIPLITNTRIADCTQAIKHGNGRDWWVITKYSSDVLTFINRFYVFLVTPNGITGPDTLDFGNAGDGDLQKLIFNNKGDKLININYIGLMTEYDFDRCSGLLSNPNIIYPEQSSNFNRLFWEGACSSNDSLLYVSTSGSSSFPVGYLIQYDLFSSSIPQSADTLDTFTLPIGTGAVRQAPDGKIYFSRAYEWGLPGFPYNDTIRNYINENLSVINYPDSLGAACDYQPFSFYLGGKRTYYGLPNNPNYELGPVVGSACDTIANGITSPKSETAKLYIFFHSGWNTAFVNAENLKGKTFNLRIVDLLGKELYSEKGKLSSSYFTRDINCSHLTGGVYILTLETDKEIISKKFVKP